MPPFPFRRRIVPEFTVPPAEATAIQRLAELQSRQDAALRLIDGLCGSVSSEVQDALLEVRLVLRPAVPVVPGRVERSAENYWENP